MTKRPPLALLIIVALAFFLVGLYSVAGGLGTGPDGASVTPTRPISSIALDPQGTSTTFLILGVDDLTTPKASLKAIWFISFGYPAMDVYMLGLSPSLTPPGSDRPLETSFQWTPGEGVPASFAEELSGAVPLEITATFVLDEPGFASVVDYLGGVLLSSSQFEGAQVLGILSLTTDDPQASLELQRRLLEAMAARASLLGRTPEITELVELIPTHLYSSISINQAVMLVAPLLPIEIETTHIETY